MAPRTERDGYVLRAPADDAEWAAYHRIRRTALFEQYHPEVVYDPKHPDEHKAENHPLVLIEDGTVIGTIRIDLFDADRAAFRIVAIDRDMQGQGHGTVLLKMAEDLVREAGRRKVVLHANPANVAFYLRNGYREEAWEGDSALAEAVDMAKELSAPADPAIGARA